MAEQSISSIEEHILHHFFRIYVQDSEIWVLTYLNKNLNDKNLLMYYENENSKNFIFLKNIAILSTTILFENKLVEKSLPEFNVFCVNLWAEILNNEKYLKDFKKLYLLDDEI